ncbi:Dcp1p-Dcp2p decapping enzyme complex alpha subunit [Ascosphaera pollenicola]|nr:Dcp1p-Dcp2p decapping enzyme complex alpha subunit [Ascosphaera pollenicola]
MDHSALSTVPELDEIGQPAHPDLEYQLKSEISALLDRPNRGFPGAQPVSFARRHLHELLQRDYYLVEKTDGIRCLLYCARGDERLAAVHYLIDRKNCYRYVSGLHFPTPGDPNREHIDTILDGELVYDRNPDGTRTLKYLVFDCLVIDGNRLIHRTLDKRLGYFKENILKPYRRYFDAHPHEPRQFIVEDKATQFSYGVEMMFREIIPRVKSLHGNDGLIFTCRSTPYQFGTDQYILKWKPPQENTIDFRMRLEFPTTSSLEEPRHENGLTTSQQQHNDSFTDYDAIPSAFLFIFTGNQGPGNQPSYQYFSPLYISPSDWEHMKSLNAPLDDSIVEAYQDNQKRWRFMRLRDDKDECNHISTVESVIESIEDRVDEHDLIGYAKAIKDAWKIRDQEAKDLRGMATGTIGVKRKLDE